MKLEKAQQVQEIMDQMKQIDQEIALLEKQAKALEEFQISQLLQDGSWGLKCHGINDHSEPTGILNNIRFNTEDAVALLDAKKLKCEEKKVILERELELL